MQLPKNKDKMEPNIEISKENLKKVATILRALLIDEYQLYSKTRNASWNIKGKYFIELHKFVENKFCHIDYNTQKILSLRYRSLKLLGDNLKVVELSKQEDYFIDQNLIIQKLIEVHESLICSMQRDIVILTNEYKDLGTAGFITELIAQYEKMVWKPGNYL